MPRYDLDGQVAIVTGAGRGIGQAIALRLAREGVNVAVADLNEDNVGEVAAEINATGGHALALKVDVTRKDDVERMVRKTENFYLSFMNRDISQPAAWRETETEYSEGQFKESHGNYQKIDLPPVG